MILLVPPFVGGAKTHSAVPIAPALGPRAVWTHLRVTIRRREPRVDHEAVPDVRGTNRSPWH